MVEGSSATGIVLSIDLLMKVRAPHPLVFQGLRMTIDPNYAVAIDYNYDPTDPAVVRTNETVVNTNDMYSSNDQPRQTHTYTLAIASNDEELFSGGSEQYLLARMLKTNRPVRFEITAGGKTIRSREYYASEEFLKAARPRRPR